MSTPYELEKKTSAITLSDMELFVFPDLMYGLVLANIMSPRIWKWREDPWFEGIAKMKPYRRVTRLKQFIMDHYVFNLDLDTWGLTTKAKEIERFRSIIDPETIRQANGLFGYEGDKYYFDIDIRTHFGLDKYDGDVIPYWKTETVEAMDAFRHRPHYGTGAGECVSLAALYTAALFVVCGIPLRRIYMMATPLHSQDYVDVDDGILTNNRRLVTRKMWFNGTAISAQARRALENERVTIVAHESGYIHMVYEQATIDRESYATFAGKLHSFLRVALTVEILGNFLRHSREIQKCFQLRWPVRGVDHYVPVERLFEYEDGSSYLLTDRTRDKLIGEVDMEELRPIRIPGRMVLNDLEAYVRERQINLEHPADVRRLQDQFACDCLNADRVIGNLIRFCCVQPRLPNESSKKFVPSGTPFNIEPDMSRESILARLESIRAENHVADMAFYAYRDLNRTEAEPFVQAAMERNPVSVLGAKDWTEAQAVERVVQMPDESIYDEAGRLAQPDEVWNFGRGDGAEKALLLANILNRREKIGDMLVDVTPGAAVLSGGYRKYEFASRKGLKAQAWVIRP